MPQTPFYPLPCPWPVRPADVPKPVMTVNHRSPDSHGNVNIGAGGGGDVMHADFEDMQPGGKMTLDEVSGKVDDLIRRLKGTAAVAFALLSLSSFAALGPTTRFGAVHPDTTLREVVEAGGGGGTIPAKVSDLENDLGFVDRTVTNGLASVGMLPAKVSDLTNDAGYVTASVTNGVTASITNFYAAVSNAAMTAHADTTNLVVSVTNAIEAQIAALQDSKRDKSDRAVYSVTQTENTDWTWTGENAEEIVEALNNAHSKPYRVITSGQESWVDIDPFPFDRSRYSSYGIELADISTTSLWYKLLDMELSEVTTVYASRPRYMDETLDPSTNAVLAAVVTNGTGTVAPGDMVKLSENGRLVKAIEGTDYLKTHQDISGKLDKSGGQMTGILSGGSGFGWIMNRQGESLQDILGTFPTYLDLATKADCATTLSGYGITDGATKKDLAAKRDLADNVCRKTEFTEWICNPPRTEFGGVYSIRYDSPVKVYTLFDNQYVVEEIYSPTDDKLNLEFVGYCTATRSAVCTSNELFVTQSFVTNAVNAAKYVPSAADPTFSNAVNASISGLSASKITSGTFPDSRIASSSVWNSKQAKLVSGANIKTINNQSILGSGNIEISAPQPAAEKRYAMFIIRLNETSYDDQAGHFTQFELKASTNNFSTAYSQKDRCCFYSHSGHAEGEFSTNDGMHLFINHGGADQRSYVRIENTAEGMPDYAPAEVIVIVDAALMNRDRSDGSWLYEGNEDVMWTWVRTKDNTREFDGGTDHCLWRPITPVRWYSTLPNWAREGL